MQKKRLILTAILISLATLLSSCGFKLKGTIPTLQNIELYINNQTPQDQLNPDNNWEFLEKELKNSGIILTNTAQDANYILIISDHQTQQEETAIGSNNSREILVSERYTIQLINQTTGHSDTTTVQNSSSITFHANQYIGNTEELKTTYRRIARENAAHVLRFIEAKTTHE